MANQLLMPWGTFTQILIFQHLFVKFKFGAHVGQADRWTDNMAKTRNASR